MHTNLYRVYLCYTDVISNPATHQTTTSWSRGRALFAFLHCHQCQEQGIVWSSYVFYRSPLLSILYGLGLRLSSSGTRMSVKYCAVETLKWRGEAPNSNFVTLDSDERVTNNFVRRLRSAYLPARADRCAQVRSLKWWYSTRTLCPSHWQPGTLISG